MTITLRMAIALASIYTVVLHSRGLSIQKELATTLCMMRRSLNKY